MTNTKINRSDLKIFPSERLTDNEDGGGMPTGTSIQGVANELFDPISSISRINGGFFTRKIFAGVQRADDEPLIGAFMAITKPPKDESVSYLLFPATKFGESRADILKRIEAYSVATIESRMTLLSTQSANSGIVQAYQRVGEPLPMIGDVYCLRQDKAGYPAVEQYIQATKVTSENRQFTTLNGTFWRTVVKMEISNKLNNDFIGVEYPVETYANAPCKIRETHVADAGRYYGVKPLAKAIEKDVQKIIVPSLMEKIVPVNQVETALVDMQEGQQTLTVDSGFGEIKNITIQALIYSYKEDITLANRSYNYTADLINPKRGSVTAKFLAQGTWYELKDDSNGKLVGASQRHGSGSINYDTGSVVISCGELPDINSAIIVNYSKDIFVKPQNPSLNAYLAIQLSNGGTDITISSGGKTGTVVGNQITGEITGVFDPPSRTLKINPSIGKNEIVVRYNSGEQKSEVLTANNLRIATTPITPKSVFLRIFFADRAYDSYYTDDGLGNLLDKQKTVGTINYNTGEISLNETSINREEFENRTEQVKVGTRRVYHGDFNNFTVEPLYTTVVREQNAKIIKRYELTSVVAYFTTLSQDKTERFDTPELTIDIESETNYQDIVDLSFSIGNQTYQEINKQIFSNALVVGSRTEKQIMLSQFNSVDKIIIKSFLVKTHDDTMQHLTFTTPRIRRKSLKLNIDNEYVEADLQGRIQKNGQYYGHVDAEVGLVMLHFSAPIKNISWQAVALSYLPVSSAVVKIDTVRLPQDGRVPIFRKGDTILISNTIEQNLGSAFTGNQTIQLNRNDLDRICLQDSNGKAVLADLWQYDLVNGSITFAQSLDLSGYQLPLIAKHTQEEKNLVTEVDIDGTLTLRFATKRAYPIENTYVSSVLICDKGNLQVNVSVPFTQRNWSNVWQDTPIGEQLLNKLNVKDYPIVLTDDGAITERWVIIWKSASQFELYGERLGFVLKTDTLQDLAPINPATKKPYFTIPKQAFGNDAPWAVQDVIRFNTEGTLMPVWILCAVQPTANPLNEEDGFTVCLFGDTTEI